MAERPAKVGSQNVLSAWDDAVDGCPCFSIWWNSRDKAKQYAGSDMDEARTVLEKWLDSNAQPGDNSLYYLRIHPDPEKAYKWNSPIVESIPFRFNPTFDNQYGMGGGGHYGVMAAINGLNETMSKRQSALEARLDEMDNGGANQDELWGKISGILDNPHIGPVIGNIIAQVVSKFTNAQRVQPLPRVAINGVNAPVAEVSQNNAVNAGTMDEDYLQRVNDALLVLQDHCDLAEDLTLLANIAKTKPDYFKMMLSMLRQ